MLSSHNCKHSINSNSLSFSRLIPRCASAPKPSMNAFRSLLTAAVASAAVLGAVTIYRKNVIVDGEGFLKMEADRDSGQSGGSADGSPPHRLKRKNAMKKDHHRRCPRCDRFVGDVNRHEQICLRTCSKCGSVFEDALACYYHENNDCLMR